MKNKFNFFLVCMCNIVVLNLCGCGLGDDVTDDMKNWGIIIELEKDNTVEQVVVRIE